MNKHRWTWYFAITVTLLLQVEVMYAINPGDIRTIRDNVFQPALQSLDGKSKTVSIDRTVLNKACGAINSQGLASYANYFTEFYKPFVEAFGGSPKLMCDEDSMAKANNVENSLKAALPLRGGSYTAQTIQAALKAIKDYITSGGSYLLFTSEWDDLINNLKVDTSKADIQPTATPTISATNVAQDPTVVTIAQALSQVDDVFLNADGTAVADMGAFKNKVLAFNNPNDDRTNPKSVTGMIDQAINKYYRTTGDDALFFNGYPTVSSDDYGPSWGDILRGMLNDLNGAYARLDEYTAQGKNAIASFEYDTESESLNTIIPKLVTAAKANATPQTGTTGGADLATDANLKIIAKALSGINGEPNKKDTYLTADGKVDVNKLSNMANFATQLRSALDLWQGDLTDEAAVAAPKLRFAENNFDVYKNAVNNAVADETDIINTLYGTDGTDGFFAQIGQLYDKTLKYDIDKMVSGNIFGDELDDEGNIIMSPDSMVGMFDALITEAGQKGGASADSTTYTLDNDDTLVALATMLADQIAAHNAAVGVLAARCTAMQSAFSDSSDTNTVIKLVNGDLSVTGAIGGSVTSSRAAVQKVFKDVMDGDANNGMMIHFNKQATALNEHMKALASAGIGAFVTSDEEVIKTIDYFSPKTVTVGNGTTSGKIDVKVVSYTVPFEE